MTAFDNSDRISGKTHVKILGQFTVLIPTQFRTLLAAVNNSPMNLNVKLGENVPSSDFEFRTVLLLY